MAVEKGVQKGEQKEQKPVLVGIDYVELYVGNPLQAAHFYRTAFGFTPIAYAGLETKSQERASLVMQQGECRLILTAALQGHSSIADYVQQHGDGVKDIAIRVHDTKEAFELAVTHGAIPLMEPTRQQGETGEITKATVALYGDIVHSFIQRDESKDFYLPGYATSQSIDITSTGLDKVDHFAVCLQQGQVEHWVKFYTETFGFRVLHQDDVATSKSAMHSVAIQDHTENIKFVFIEPKSGTRKSQIEEFLQFHGGSGIQHIALHSTNIVQTVRALAENGIRFATTPESYYELLPERIGSISESIADLSSTAVLVDRDEWGYLLQIFSLPVQSRPTLFIEIIQRKGARGFGNGNILALFKALEREQARRGNL